MRSAFALVLLCACVVTVESKGSQVPEWLGRSTFRGWLLKQCDPTDIPRQAMFSYAAVASGHCAVPSEYAGDKASSLQGDPQAACFAPLAPQVSAASATTFSTATHGASSVNCTKLLGLAVTAFTCAIGAGNYSSFLTASGLAAVSSTMCMPDATLPAGVTAHSTVAAAVTWIQNGGGIVASCSIVSDADITVTGPCPEAVASVAAGPRAQLEKAFPTSNADAPVCDNGIERKCVRCLPLVSENVVTQPYEFVVIPGLKLVLLKLFELFVLFRVINWVRNVVEEENFTRVPPDDTHTEEFLEYFVDEALRGGRFRLREHLTLRNEFGKETVIDIRDAFEKAMAKHRKEFSGGGDGDTQGVVRVNVEAEGGSPREANDGPNGPVLPRIDDEQWKKITGPLYMAVDQASWTRRECLSACMDLLQSLGVVEDDDDGDTRDNEMVDWYYNELCQYGARRPLLPLRKDEVDSGKAVRRDQETQQKSAENAAAIHKSFEAQLAVLARRNVLLLQPPTEDEIVDAELHAQGGDTLKDKDKAKLRAEILFHEKAKREAVGGAFIGEFDAEAFKEREQEGYVDVTFRCANPGATNVECTFFARERRQIRATQRALSKALALRDVLNGPDGKAIASKGWKRVLPEGTDVNAGATAALRDGTGATIAVPRVTVHLFDGTLVNLDERLCDLTKLSPSLNFWYLVHLPNVSQQDGTFEPFDSVEDDLERLRSNLMDTCAFDAATFDREFILRDTKDGLARVLDPRPGTTARHFIAQACGEEYVYECDLTAEERYAIRDAIPQIAGRPKKATPTDTSPMALPELNTPPKTPTKVTAVAMPSAPTDVNALEQPPKPESGSRPHSTTEDRPSRSLSVALDGDDIENADALLHVDPTESYNQCYDHLTRYVTWDGSSIRFGVIKVFEAERDELVDVLSSMYIAVKDRLLADGRDTLDEAVVRGIAERFRPHVDDVSRLVKVVLIDEQVWKVIFGVNSFIVLISEVYAIVFFILCIVAGQDDPHRNAWQQYENIFFRFVNSGSPGSLFTASIINMVVNRQARFEFWPLRITDFASMGISTTLLICPLVTHIIPGWILYCWIVGPVIAILTVPVGILWAMYRFFRRAYTSDASAMEKEIRRRKRVLKLILTIGLLVGSFVCLVVITTLLQTGFNWAFIMYRRDQLDTEYVKVPGYEYDTRSIACYVEKALDSTANIAQFFSAFIG